jgi:hypothetical protein
MGNGRGRPGLSEKIARGRLPPLAHGRAIQRLTRARGSGLERKKSAAPGKLYPAFTINGASSLLQGD